MEPTAIRFNGMVKRKMHTRCLRCIWTTFEPNFCSDFQIYRARALKRCFVNSMKSSIAANRLDKYLFAIIFTLLCNCCDCWWVCCLPSHRYDPDGNMKYISTIAFFVFFFCSSFVADSVFRAKTNCSNNVCFENVAITNAIVEHIMNRHGLWNVRHATNKMAWLRVWQRDRAAQSHTE